MLALVALVALVALSVVASATSLPRQAPEHHPIPEWSELLSGPASPFAEGTVKRKDPR